jgi:hypothetical protein
MARRQGASLWKTLLVWVGELTVVLVVACQSILAPASTSVPQVVTTATPISEKEIRKVVLDATMPLTRGGQLYQSLDKIAIEGDWAVVTVGLKDTSTNAYVGADGLIVLVHRENGSWIAAMPGSDKFRLWLDQIPTSILSADDKRFLKGSRP